MKPKITADNKIPFIQGSIDRFADATYIAGSAITADNTKTTDALLTRTRTKCDRQLLESSNIRFIGTATIGFDHIDLDYCRAKGITVSIASGCNAGGVVHYCLTALATLGINSDKTVGIIGVGNVGSLLHERLTAYGFKTILNDPPKAATSKENTYQPLDTLLSNSDIITIHTPLIKEGEYKTEQLAGVSFFDRCKPGAIFINTSRGETTDERALIHALDSGKIAAAVIDVWDTEPIINRELLKKATITTPHIAGYSLQGKANGSAITVRAFAEHFDIEPLKEWYPQDIAPRTTLNTSWDETKKKLTTDYKINTESDKLKKTPEDFEKMRDNYDYRNEVI